MASSTTEFEAEAEAFARDLMGHTHVSMETCACEHSSDSRHTNDLRTVVSSRDHMAAMEANTADAANAANAGVPMQCQG